MTLIREQSLCQKTPVCLKLVGFLHLFSVFTLSPFPPTEQILLKAPYLVNTVGVRLTKGNQMTFKLSF